MHAPNTAVVLLQNGVGVEQPYRVAFPKNPIISAVEYVSASQDKGIVIVGGGRMWIPNVTVSFVAHFSQRNA